MNARKKEGAHGERLPQHRQANTSTVAPAPPGAMPRSTPLQQALGLFKDALQTASSEPRTFVAFVEIVIDRVVAESAPGILVGMVKPPVGFMLHSLDER